jgi:Predicted phosphohydrolases
MKIWILSDLHLRMSDIDWDIEFPDADVCVVAGDVTDPPLASLAWLQEKVGNRMPVVFVAGNHEYYGHSYVEALAEAKCRASDFPDVHFLEKDEVVIDGVRFLGATMWTDFELYGTPERSMQVAALQMNDYRCIDYSSSHGRRFSPEITRAIQFDTRSWLESELAKPFDGPTVVVSHTCPHTLSIHQDYAGDALNPAFTSDLSTLIETFEPDVWVHGHTHSSFDYLVPNKKTRVVCNPRGYVRRWNMGYQVENMMFERYKVIEVA